MFGNMSSKPRKYCENYLQLEKESKLESEQTVLPNKMRKQKNGEYYIVQHIPPIIIKLSAFNGMDPAVVKIVQLC